MTKAMKRGRHDLLPLLAAALLWCACAKPLPGNRFYTYIQSDPGKLDPFYSTDVVSGRVLTALFNGLFLIDEKGLLQKDLVESYTFDGKTLFATLRRGVRFHSGHELTSDDVIFSLSRVGRSENPTSPRKWVFSDVAGYERLDGRRFVIRLAGTRATFLHRLTMPCAYIISKKDFEERGAVVGTGPFMLSEWRQDDRIALVKNPRYHGGAPSIDGMVFRVIPEDLTARFEFLNGTLDYFDVPYVEKIDFRGKASRVAAVSDLSVHYVALNTQRAPFSNREFRRALNMAVDRKAIMRSLFRDRFTEARGVIPPGVAGYRSSGACPGYDPEGAVRIIRGLGLAGSSFDLLIKADNQVSLIAQMLQHYLGKAGISLRVVPLEWSALKSRTYRGDFSMAFYTWSADYPEPENYLYPLFHSESRGAGGNRSFYANPAVDRLLERARLVMSAEKRFDIYRAAEGIILDDSPWIFLWYGDKRIALSRRVKEYTAYPVFSGLKGDAITMIRK